MYCFLKIRTHQTYFYLYLFFIALIINETIKQKTKLEEPLIVPVSSYNCYFWWVQKQPYSYSAKANCAKHITGSWYMNKPYTWALSSHQLVLAMLRTIIGSWCTQIVICSKDFWFHKCSDIDNLLGALIGFLLQNNNTCSGSICPNLSHE